MLKSPKDANVPIPLFSSVPIDARISFPFRSTNQRRPLSTQHKLLLQNHTIEYLNIFETTLSHPHSSSMKLSIAVPSLAALVLPAIVAADDRHVARFDVTKLFPGADFRVDADPALQSSTLDDNLGRSYGALSGRTYGSADVYPSLIKKIQRAMNMAVNVDKEAAFHKVQMLHMTQTSTRHVDGVREVVGGSIKFNPLKKSEATTAFYVQEASPDSYFETDDDELCIPFVEGSAVYFDGRLPHQSILKSGAVKLLGPFQLSSLRSVGTCLGGAIECTNDPSACDQDPGTCCLPFIEGLNTYGCCDPCPTTTTTTSTSLPAKSGKSSSSGTKSGKGSKALGGAGSGNEVTEASAGADDPMLFAAEGLLSTPTEFNEWGKLVSMSMENEESTNF